MVDRARGTAMSTATPVTTAATVSTTHTANTQKLWFLVAVAAAITATEARPSPAATAGIRQRNRVSPDGIQPVVWRRHRGGGGSSIGTPG